MKRWLAGFLALIFVLGCIPSAAAEASFESFFAGITAAASAENDASYPYGDYLEEDALISSNAGYSSSFAAITLQFSLDAKLEYDYLISSEKSYDYMSVVVNGSDLHSSQKGDYSGIMTEYSTYSLKISAGDTVQIGYKKDGSGDRGEDCLRLKNFRVTVYYPVTFTGCPQGTQLTVTDADAEECLVTDCRISLPTGSYSYRAEAFGYETAEDSFTVSDTALEIPVSMTAHSGQRLTFDINGLAEGIAPTVTVKHGDTVMQEQPDGSYSLVPADYTYTVKAAGYKTARGCFTMTADAQTVPVTMVAGEEWDGTVAAAFAGGSGTEQDPYQIANGEQLAYLSASVAAGNDYAGTWFVQTRELDMGLVPFTPIGSNTAQFKGNYIGSTITNLSIVSESDYIGLFGYLGEGALVRGVIVSGCVQGKRCVGGIVGYLKSATVENCASYAAVRGSSTYVGGICGQMNGNSTAKSQITRCFNAGNVTSGTNNHAGGIAGYVSYGDISECYNLGAISGTRAGGITAQLSSNCTISSCYNLGTVTLTMEGSYNYAGSIVGYNMGTVASCVCLEGTTAIGSGSGVVKAVSIDVMKSAQTVLDLGGSFVEDKKNLNGGYPILAWQDPTATLLVVFEINYTDARVAVYDAAGTEIPAEADGNYNLLSGTYTYTVTLEECDPVEGSFTVNGTSLRIVVTLNVKTYPVAFTLSPSDARIVIHNAAGEEMALGEKAHLPKGAYAYEVSKFGYLTKSGSFTVTGESDALIVTLTEAARYSVSFTVTDESGAAIENTEITVTHSVGGAQTADNGVYALPDGTYQYTVKADGYINIRSSFTVAGAAQTIPVTMQEGSNVWSGAVAEEAPQTQEIDGKTYYLITTSEELAWFAEAVKSDGTLNGKLMANLLLNSEEAPTVNRWNGIGSYSAKYAGTFDGNGKQILGYYSKYESYTGGNGLFGYLGEGAIVKNLTLSGMIEGDGTVGTIAGQSYGRIEGCVSRVNITNKSACTGGIVGRAYSTAAIVNCGNEGNITSLLNSTYSDAKVGGIVGESYCAVIDCYNSGNIDGGSKNSGKVAGILGYTNNGDTRIENCYNLGAISGTDYVAGISARHTMGTAPRIQNCYSVGTITASAGATHVGTIAGDLLGTVENCYYLSGSGEAAVGYIRDGVTITASAKESTEMKTRDFVLLLGNTAYQLDTNGGYPVLAWQGGEHVVDTESAAAVAAVKDALTVTPTTVTEACVLDLPISAEGFGGTICWKSSDESIIATDGTVTLPLEGTSYVTLTATISLAGESATKQFVITVISLAAQYEQRLTDAQSWLNGKSSLSPICGEDANLCAYVQTLLGNAGYTGITVSVTQTGTLTYPAALPCEAGIAENGDITYFSADPTSLTFAVRGATINDAQLQLSLGGQSRSVTVTVHLEWDKDAVTAYLAHAAQCITFDSIRGDNTDQEHITQNMLLPQRLSAYPYVTVAWASSSEIIEISGDAFSDTLTAQVRAPSEDAAVTLTPTLTFVLNDGTMEMTPFTLTVLAEDLEPLRAQMQQSLNECYLTEKLIYIVGKQPIDPQAVCGDIQLLTPAKAGIEDYSSYRFTVTSSDESFIRVNGYRAVVYQPMPDEAPASATLTVTMQHKEKAVSVSKTIDLMVIPLTVGELDAALTLMDEAKAHYWDGINDGANSSCYSVSKSLHPFREVTRNADGSLRWAYAVNDCLQTGIVAGDMADFSVVGGQEQYNKFKSSVPSVIAHETLLLSLPKYNTAVTIESVLEHETYAKYAETVRGKWYDEYFSKLVGQKVSATMTVLGTDGANPDGEQPPTLVAVTVRLTGVNEVGAIDRTFETTSDKTVAEVLQLGFGEAYTMTVSDYGYIESLHGDEAFEAANAKVPYWGQYFFVNGEYDTASTLSTLVEDGGVYGVFANETTSAADSFYGYKYNVWLHEAALTVSAGEEFGVTVYQMVGSSAMAQSNISVFCGETEVGKTNQDGNLITAFNQVGTYVLNTGDENHTYSQCVVTVTEKEHQLTAVTEKAPTCTESGNIAYWVCSACGKYYRDAAGTTEITHQDTIVQPSGHTAVIDPAVPASCTDSGKTKGMHCSFCNRILEAQKTVPALGHSFGAWMITGAPTCTKNGKQTHFCTVCGVSEEETIPTLACQSGKMTDVPKNIWYHDAVDYMMKRGHMKGVSSTSFDPEGTVTRAQLVTVLYRIAGEPKVEGKHPFTDVSNGQWYSDAITWASRNGVVNGVTQTTFAPDSPVTREQIAVLLYRYTKSEAIRENKLSAFSDTEKISGYAFDAMNWAVAEELIVGNDGKLLPQDSATRAEIATILMRLLEK